MNFHRVEIIYVNNVPVEIHVDKNNQVCDIFPRIGDALNKYQGRPVTQAVLDGIKNEMSLTSEILNYKEDYE